MNVQSKYLLLIISCLTVVIAFCCGHAITLNPRRATRRPGDNKQSVYVARTANCFANRTFRATAGFRICSRCASTWRAIKMIRGFTPSLIKPRICPSVINFALSRMTIFTLPDRAYPPLNSSGPTDIYQRTPSRVASPLGSVQLGPARLDQQVRRLHLPSKIARHIFTILLHF